MTPKQFPSLVPLSHAKTEIGEGDLLLFAGNPLIAIAGRGRYSHAGKVSWWDEELFCLEVREFLGGRAVILDRLVQQQPGKIDVFEANANRQWSQYDPNAASAYMRRLTGCTYGWRNVLKAALSHLFLARLWVRPSQNDEELSRHAPFCSQAIMMAERLAGGVDPVPWLADHSTEPSDLARSPFYRYRFTLTDG